LPARLTSVVEALLDLWGKLDGTRPPGNIIPFQPGQEYEIRKNLFVYAFATNHCNDSLGFTVIERRLKLKPEYSHLTGQEIARLRKNGEQVTYVLDIPLVTYLGDTMGGEFEKLECVRKSKVLIAECTFFEQDCWERARAGRHYHFGDLSKFLQKTENEHILLTHLSRRTDIHRARKMVDQALPSELAERIHFLMQKPYKKRKIESDAKME
jgi:ribonuclease BN (tRNA processing enzyme)